MAKKMKTLTLMLEPDDFAKVSKTIMNLQVEAIENGADKLPSASEAVAQHLLSI